MSRSGAPTPPRTPPRGRKSPKLVQGQRVLALECDVGDEAAVEACFARTVETLGQVDGCFANAGVSGRSGGKPFFEMAADEWRRVMRVNLDGAFYTLRAASRHMVHNKIEGVLAGTASLAAIEASPRSEHYAATKGGMISMMKSLAVELARYGIRAHSIVPGWIDTNMTEKTLASDGFQNKVFPRVPMRRWGTGDDFGGIAVYLMSVGVTLSHRRYVRDRWGVFVVLGWRRENQREP